MTSSVRYKRTFFRKSSESWCGNYAIAGDQRHPNRDLVEVMIFEELNGSGYRVAVWGNDDLGMEKEFSIEAFDEALVLFRSLASAVDINTEMLSVVGFQWA